MPLMTLKEYAAHRGISPAAVSIAVKDGRCPVTLDPSGRKVIDSEHADEQWTIGGGQGQKPKEIKNAQPRDPSVPPIIDSRSIKEAFQARIAKLDYEERVGKTLDAEKVKEETFKVARIVRDNLLNIPDRLAAELAGEENQFIIHKKLTDEIKRAITDVINIIQNQEQYE